MSFIDKKVKDELHARTDKDIDLKDDIWNNLENTLFADNKMKERSVKKLKKRNRTIPLMITVAAGILLAFSLQSDTGTALMKGIKELFVPEKEVIQNIEGTEEETNVQLNEGTDAKYIIYIDETRYKLTNGEQADMITTIEPLPEKYPEVTMEIKQVQDEKPEVLIEKFEEQLKIEFPDLKEVEEVTEPLKGFMLHGINGSEADSKVVNAYVISNGKSGSFVITQNYFLEAAEGHGARFYHMLESFEIVE